MAASIVLLLARGEGERPDRRIGTATTAGTASTAPPEPAHPRLAIGISEQNPHLIAPGHVPGAFATWRDRVAELRPRWFRLLVDWSKVQPSPDAPPDWSARADGCLRGAPPCAPYGGVADLLRAVAARQASDGGWEVVATVYGAPRWALDPAEGCPAGGAIRIDAYAALLRSLDRLSRDVGLRIRWWSPWNEPNHPTFIAPQRMTCDPRSAALSPGAYAALVRAARATLPAEARLVLGDVAGYDRPRSQAVGAAELAAALPRDVACSGEVWAQHAYVGRGATRLAADRDAGGSRRVIGSVERALERHGCERPHRIWITETGAAPGPASCAGMDRALRAWEAHPRVDVAIQYTVREDSAFRVGLATTGLRRTRPAYRAWHAWGGERDPFAPPPREPCRGDSA